MSSMNTSDVHKPVTESGAPAPSEGSQTGDDFCRPAKMRKVEPDPHARDSYADMEDSSEPRDVSVRSVCCGADVRGGEPVKGDWHHPSSCFVGWHTTDVDAVEEQYNGVNVLRCDLGPGVKCRRAQMKFLHHARYENLFDKRVKYIQIDKEDHMGYLKRKREEINDDDEFKDAFCFMEESDGYLVTNSCREKDESDDEEQSDYEESDHVDDSD
ncbi:hypothetical protein OG21DRAFT_1521992 [Imleria badia]|nr:hypothetical protein OG21DRAFT_1521992 [Imleria badia]